MAGRVGRLDRKIKHLAALEASYRKELRTAQEGYDKGHVPPPRYRRIKARCERKIGKLLDQIRDLRAKRTEVSRR